MKEEIQKNSKRELTPQEKNIAYSLESLPTFSIRGKMDLMLVWRKLKSASQLYLHADLSDREFQDIKNKIQKAGLFFIDKGIDTNVPEGAEPTRLCFVANNNEDLELISKIWFGDHFSDPKVYKEIGRMSGFPQTAIDTYYQIAQMQKDEKEKVRQELVLSEEEKYKLLPREVYPFSLSFFMSKKHWQKEMEIPKKWSEEIALTAPTLYQDYMKAFK